jgi:putative oxidoreductase
VPTSLGPYALALLRVVSALLFIEHGTQKLLNFPAAARLPAMFSMGWFAGCIELVGGILVLAGVGARYAALIMSGEMALAYWTSHVARGLYPVLNGGDAAILFCFVFLYIAAAGPGPFSWDERRKG